MEAKDLTIMTNKEKVGVNLVDVTEPNGINKSVVFSVLKKYEGKVPLKIWGESLSKVNKIFEEFEAPEGALKSTATSAFLVHTRRNRKNSTEVDEFKQLDDSTKILPILDPQYGIEEEDVERLWNSLPPFRGGEINGTFNGKKIKCAIISVPITPQGLEKCTSNPKRVSYARSRILQAAKLADKMGAKTIGLGETLASLTDHGKKLQKECPGMNITTGHAFTTYFMNEWTKFVAKKAEIDLGNSPVTIIGANGSIGSSMIEMLLHEGVSNLRLHDKEKMVGALEIRRKEILKNYPNVRVEITGGNAELRNACKGSRIVLVAASAPEPFIRSKDLDPETFIINDSQPPSITRVEARKADSTTLWVVGALPEGFINTLDSGLVNTADWTCALEVIALEMEGSEVFETVGPVTPERVMKAGEIAHKFGIGLPKAQSWGALEDVDSHKPQEA
jgi:fatty aldehyde-generating acyl-ACP reductase